MRNGALKKSRLKKKITVKAFNTKTSCFNLIEVLMRRTKEQEARVASCTFITCHSESLQLIYHYSIRENLA